MSQSLERQSNVLLSKSPIRGKFNRRSKHDSLSLLWDHRESGVRKTYKERSKLNVCSLTSEPFQKDLELPLWPLQYSKNIPITPPSLDVPSILPVQIKSLIRFRCPDHETSKRDSRADKQNSVTSD